MGYIREYATEEDPMGESLTAINELLDDARLQNLMVISVFKEEEMEIKALTTKVYGPHGGTHDAFIIDEDRDNPMYYAANRWLRAKGHTWRFRIPHEAERGDYDYTVCLRQYENDEIELANMTLLPAIPPIKATIKGPEPAGKFQAYENYADTNVPIDQKGQEPFKGHWVGDLWMGDKPPTRLDFVWKDCLALLDPKFYKKLEERIQGDDDYGDPNYGRMMALSRLFGWLEEQAGEDAFTGGDGNADFCLLLVQLGWMAP